MDKASQKVAERPAWLEVVRDQAAALHFGHIQIVVHNAKVVQVEITSRIRFNRPLPESEPKSP